MSVRVVPAGGWPDDDPPPVPPGGLPDRIISDRQSTPVIELRGVRLPVGPGRPRPDQEPRTSLDLKVGRGELVTLTGQPRSGRSALLNVLGLLDRPAAGTYLLNGVDTTRLGDRDRSALRGRQIGFVFQRKMLLPTRSVLDNVMLPLRYTGLRRRQRAVVARSSLDRVGLAASAALLTWQLSADELALCAIARALVTQPSLLLCDEPTAGTGQATAAMIIGVLAGLHREGRTILIATADQLAAAYSSRTIELGQPETSLPARPPGLTSATRDTAAITDAQAGPP
ncbi:MAG TPA: ATP-binding cassette domain-containing protein [Streptosporangiaceae bacterium]|nr:ATP-binding cassette domain-containing protein [Streptosporangiaceae bacterium]